jgi:HAD superfamily hydrolase (TIGR01509 family)
MNGASKTRALVFDRDGVLTRFDFGPLMALFEDVPKASFEALWRAWQVHVRIASPPRRARAEATYVAAFWRTVREAWSFDAKLEERLNDFDYTTAIRPFPDALPTLEAARAAGMKIAVLSNFPFVGLAASLKAAGLDHLVDVTFAAGVAGTPKPDPSAYLHVLDRLDVTPAESALIDDELECVLGARRLGIRGFLLDRGAAEATSEVVPDLHAFLRVATEDERAVREEPLAETG